MSNTLALLIVMALEGQRPPVPRPVVERPTPVIAPVERAVPIGGRLVPFVTSSVVFDSNINYDRDDLDAYGGVVGGGIAFRSKGPRPAFELQYQVGLHRYARTSRWNRLSHYIRAEREDRLSKRLTLESVGEVSIKGSTEDQELSDQFVLSPRLEYRLTRSVRLRAYGTLRLKRYDGDPGRNAFNRYGGTEAVVKTEGGTRWSAGGRYEWNGARSPRQQYARWTWHGDVSQPLGPRDRVELGMRYRVASYPYRLVDVKGGPDVPRHDTRWEPAIDWVHTIDAGLEVSLGYAYRARESNDARREYESHNVAVTVLRRF